MTKKGFQRGNHRNRLAHEDLHTAIKKHDFIRTRVAVLIMDCVVEAIARLFAWIIMKEGRMVHFMKLCSVCFPFSKRTDSWNAGYTPKPLRRLCGILFKQHFVEQELALFVFFHLIRVRLILSAETSLRFLKITPRTVGAPVVKMSSRAPRSSTMVDLENSNSKPSLPQNLS